MELKYRRPCYVGLKNNVSTPLLETTLNTFPEGTPDFVSHDVLKNYIQDTAHATGVHGVTQYDTEVQSLVKTGTKWNVETATLNVNNAGVLIRTTSKTVSGDCDGFIVVRMLKATEIRLSSGRVWTLSCSQDPKYTRIGRVEKKMARSY